MGKPIRIPRTTALFVTGLGRILREEYGFKIIEHEHWTFEHVGKWTKCGKQGACAVHGITQDQFDRAFEEVSQTPERYIGEWFHLAENYFTFCYPYDINVYIASGRARRAGFGKPVGTPLLDIRARIEETNWEVGGKLHIVQIWIRDDFGNSYKGEFGLHEDGMTYNTGDEPPAEPPRRIAFWRQPEPEEVTA